MPINLETFLDDYAKALNTFDTKNIGNFFLSPTIIMNDKSKKVMYSDEELEQASSRMFAKLSQVSIKKFMPKLQQTVRLSYNLQKMPDKQLKIIVAVIDDDDENKLADIFTRGG